jgi:hypothetical protein
MVTVAPGTTPPDGSVTEPTTFAVVAWGNAGQTAKTVAKATSSQTLIEDLHALLKYSLRKGNLEALR